MRKQDLKTGMIVENQNGQFGKILLNTSQGDVIGGSSNADDFWCDLDSYDDDLERSDWGSDKIIKVYEACYNKNAASLKVRGDLIWERETTPEYTMEELTDKLGHTFKIKK